MITAARRTPHLISRLIYISLHGRIVIPAPVRPNINPKFALWPPATRRSDIKRRILTTDLTPFNRSIVSTARCAAYSASQWRVI
jgi:hypothetical protein